MHDPKNELMAGAVIFHLVEFLANTGTVAVCAYLLHRLHGAKVIFTKEKINGG